MADPLSPIIEAMFHDIDIGAAQAVLKDLGLPLAYSDEAIAKINTETNVLCDEAAALKRAEARRSERRDVKEQVDRLVNTRAFLYRLRGNRPGDVTTTVASVGGKG